MVWKDLPRWLKYGLLFAGIYALISILTFSLDALTNSDIVIFFGAIFTIISLPAIWLSFIFFGRYDALYYLTSEKLIFVIIASIIIYFIIGTLIGLLVGKIKSSKK